MMENGKPSLLFCTGLSLYERVVNLMTVARDSEFG
jgi:hypothetical protein